jgi:hypothetical protein
MMVMVCTHENTKNNIANAVLEGWIGGKGRGSFNIIFRRCGNRKIYYSFFTTLSNKYLPLLPQKNDANFLKYFIFI